MGHEEQQKVFFVHVDDLYWLAMGPDRMQII
jgi:hypothetical protein